MKHSITIAAIIFFSFLLLFGGCHKDDSTVTPSEPVTANYWWPTFLGDLQRTGQSSIDASSFQGKVAWTYQLPQESFSSPVISKDGIIYIGTSDSCLYAITKDSVVLWKYRTHARIQGAPALDADGNVYCSSVNGEIYSFTAAGQFRWSALLPEGSNFSGVAINGEKVYACSNAHLNAFDRSGNPLWRCAIDAPVGNDPAIDANGIVYVLGKKLFAVYPNGSIKWTYDYTYTGGSFSSPSIGPDRTIYIFPYASHKIFAIDTAGSLKWTFAAQYGTILSTPVIAPSGGIIAADWGYVYAVNADGTLRWKTVIDASDPGPVVQDKNGNIFLGGCKNPGQINFWMLSPSGAILKKMAVRNSLNTLSDIETAPAIGPNREIYVGSDNGSFGIAKLY